VPIHECSNLNPQTVFLVPKHIHVSCFHVAGFVAVARIAPQRCTDVRTSTMQYLRYDLFQHVIGRLIHWAFLDAMGTLGFVHGRGAERDAHKCIAPGQSLS